MKTFEQVAQKLKNYENPPRHVVHYISLISLYDTGEKWVGIRVHIA